MMVQQGFLFSWGREKAWWWGVLLGDGNVYKNVPSGDYRVSVCGSHSTVTRWMNLIAPGKAVKEFKRSPGTYQGYVNSRVLVEWFEGQGLCGPKSGNLPWPEGLPDEYLRDFLRGLWDTDGSLYTRARGKGKGNPERKAVFSSKCYAFVERLRSEQTRVIGLSPVAITHNRSKLGEWYTLSYAGSAAMKLADWLYADAPEHLRNEDRYAAYLRFRDLEESLAVTCACGRAVTREGRCQACWWAERGRTTGPGTACVCGKPIVAKGMCSACYTLARRATIGA